MVVVLVIPCNGWTGYVFHRIFYFDIGSGMETSVVESQLAALDCTLEYSVGLYASQAGWIVAEVGRQPWAIQDLLPVNAAISRLETGSVQTTFFIFLIMFTVLLIAEIGIMLKAIKKGPEEV